MNKMVSIRNTHRLKLPILLTNGVTIKHDESATVPETAFSDQLVNWGVLEIIEAKDAEKEAEAAQLAADEERSMRMLEIADNLLSDESKMMETDFKTDGSPKVESIKRVYEFECTGDERDEIWNTCLDLENEKK